MKLVYTSKHDQPISLKDEHLVFQDDTTCHLQIPKFPDLLQHFGRVAIRFSVKASKENPEKQSLMLKISHKNRTDVEDYIRLTMGCVCVT